MRIRGSCHCGNLGFEIETAIPKNDIVARACDCRFCRIHGARNWSDPLGRALLSVREPAQLHRYRFALKTADFYVCRVCGAYAGAVLSDREGCWSTLNLRLTDLEVDQATASYGAEETSERVTRRKRVWTPTELGGILARDRRGLAVSPSPWEYLPGAEYLSEAEWAEPSYA